jgi:hypothetical protein
MHSSRIVSIIVAALTLVGIFVAPDPLVLLLSGTTLIVALLLLWDKSRIPVLLLPVSLQWISVATKPIESVITSTPMVGLSDFGGDVKASATFGLLGLLALTCGIRLGMGRTGDQTMLPRMRIEVTTWSDRNMLTTGCGLLLGGYLAAAGARAVAGLSEIMLALANATFCGLFILVFWTLTTGKYRWIVGLLALSEIASGMTGFFGEFRTSLFTIALAAMCAQHRFKPQTLVLGTLFTIPSLFLMVFWSSVKPDYRLFLNNGTETQIVQQPLGDRIDFLSARFMSFDGDQFNDGFSKLVARASYIDFLAMTMEYVPSNTPHENGARTLQALTHIVTPRIIFADKPPLESDTVVAAKYTGLTFTNYDYVSISIGYLAELYVDFGWLGAIVAMLVFGVIMGAFVQRILRYALTPTFLNAGLALMVVVPICAFETALIKVIGGMTATLIAAFLLQRGAFRYFIRSRGMLATHTIRPALADQSYL